MKKLIAIFFLVLFLFSAFGYRLLLDYALQQSSFALQSSIDNNTYNKDELVTVTVPLSMPYLNNQANFESINGEVTFEGKVYKYVQRKITNGSMVLLCLPDYTSTKIKKAKNDLFASATQADDKATKKADSKTTNILKGLSLENDCFITSYSLAAYNGNTASNFYISNSRLLNTPHTPLLQPPDVA